jgi:RNA polymerase sigma factor (sigma-70 family)
MPPRRGRASLDAVTGMPGGQRDDGGIADLAGVFEMQRPRLFGLAYRLLGSTSDAEDMVQDAFLRWSAAGRDAVQDPAAWLTTVVVNLCRNRLASARAQRERYVGTWLPEPVLTADGTLGPLDTAEQRDSVSLALLTLLEQLTPRERAVFVLRESFGYSHREIAQVVGASEAGCRQLHRRARQRLGDPQPRFRPDPGQWRRLVERFLVAAGEGDVAGLERLLADDVTYWSDGGGNAPVARRPVAGQARVARLFAKLIPKFAADPGFAPGAEIRQAEVNGEPALIAWIGGVLFGVIVPETAGDHITALRVMANPERLGFAARQAAALSRSEDLSGLLLVTGDARGRGPGQELEAQACDGTDPGDRRHRHPRPGGS